jgi:hypothetical protein
MPDRPHPPRTEREEWLRSAALSAAFRGYGENLGLLPGTQGRGVEAVLNSWTKFEPHSRAMLSVGPGQGPGCISSNYSETIFDYFPPLRALKKLQRNFLTPHRLLSIFTPCSPQSRLLSSSFARQHGSLRPWLKGDRLSFLREHIRQSQRPRKSTISVAFLFLRRVNGEPAV